MCLNCGPTYGHEPDCKHMLAAEAQGTRFEPWGEDGLMVAVPDRPDNVNHPQHYGGDTLYETIKVMIAWDAQMAYCFCVGNSIKYLSRIGKKDPDKVVEDLGKAAWYAEQAAEIYREHLAATDAALKAKATERLHEAWAEGGLMPGEQIVPLRAWHGGERD